MLKKLFSMFTKKKSSLKTEPVTQQETIESASVLQTEEEIINGTDKEAGELLSPEEIYTKMEWAFLGLNPESGYIFQNIAAGKRACFVNGTLYMASVDAHTATEIAEKFNSDSNENAKKFIPEVFFCLCKKAEDEQRIAIEKALEEKELEINSRIQKARKELEEQLRSQSNSDNFVKMNYLPIDQKEQDKEPEQVQQITEEDKERIQKQRDLLKNELDSQRETLCGSKFYHKDVKIPLAFVQSISQEQMDLFDEQKKNFLSRLFVTNTVPLEMESLQKAFSVFFGSFFFVGFKRFEARLKQIPEIIIGEGDTYTGTYKQILGCLASVPVFAECIKALPVTKISPEKFFGYDDFKKGNRAVLDIFSTQVEEVVSIEDIHLLEKLLEGSRVCAKTYSDVVVLIENNDEIIEGKTLFSYFNKERISEQLSNGLKLF